MAKKLLIVESPAKAKTIGKYLGADFDVKSSVGHIRDLPKESGSIKITEKGAGKWDFVPKYIVPKDKEKVVAQLKSAAKGASEIYLASDPDREGEAIAWHLREVLKPVAGDRPFRRVAYNEITKSAVEKAVAEPRDIDMPLVDAQQARRIIDRIVGYKVSPLLWKNVSCPNSKTLSAGRVQSVALRLLVERQREIDAFVPETYFLMGVEARPDAGGDSFVARLAKFDGEKPDVRSQDAANAVLLDLAGASLEVADVKQQPQTRRPKPPFTTSTLQQAASSILGYSPGRTMQLAQELYEKGYITYMRTDSVNISESAVAAARAYIESRHGEAYRPEMPNRYRSKEGAQGAHEAIRPTNVEMSAAPSSLDSKAQRLYDLIWRRFVASQMSPARTTLTSVSIKAVKPGIVHSYLFSASATTIDFDGFLAVMKPPARKKQEDADDAPDGDEVEKLPALASGDKLSAVRWIADSKQTKGPAHYSEASLVKALEECGVGRPSTYAATIETLKTRGYAVAEKRKLIPQERGILVCDWLVKRLDDLFSVDYTSRMEAALDKVEEGKEQMDGMLSSFYSKFLSDVAACAEPPPDMSKFDLLFSLLNQVSEWKPAKKVGRRVYDDKAFVESVKEQAREGKRPLSARQLEFLVRMVLLYADQIPGAEAKLREAGMGAGAAVVKRADPELVELCFGALDRIGGYEKNPFVRSLRDQVAHGRGLTMKQFSILAKMAGENADMLPDVDDLRAKLSEFVPGGFAESAADPAIPALLEMFDSVREWREPTKRGKKMYDDKTFIDSLRSQYARRHTLSTRQALALRRVVASYREQIPDFETKAEGLGIQLRSGDGRKRKKG